MLRRLWLTFVAVALISGAAAGQILSIPTFGNNYSNALAGDPMDGARMDFAYFTINGQNGNLTPFETPSGSVSQMDLKAPGKAVSEYQKGYQLLMKKDLDPAVQHLTKAAAIYPNYVAAHNALGTAYLDLSRNEEASTEFSKAVELDDHLPNSFLNLGCAQLALKQYAGAEESFKKASSLAPMDQQLQLALAYAEYTNKDYPALIATAGEIHKKKHEGTAVVHFFAAAAHEGEGNFDDAQAEMKLLLKEDPKSPSADQYRQILAGLKEAGHHREQLKFNPVAKVSYSIGVPTGPSTEVAGHMAQLAFQDMEEKEQLAEAEEDPDPVCHECALAPAESGSSSRVAEKSGSLIIRANVDEVSILFAATDRGKSVTNLASSDIEVRDNQQPPRAILNFRNESQLPLRLGLVIDTSDSVKERIKFEEAAAIKFLEKVVTDKDDLAFVVGVNNSVLLAQDFTAEQAQIAHAVNQLAPGGGTALWDAVSFAAQKLTSRTEMQPVARVLVVISDGEDNSSSNSLKEMINTVLRNEVAVYTVSTRDDTNDEDSALLGEQALKRISELTGGAEYRPGSVGRLSSSLSDLQEVIRSRYLISYRPAEFQRDGHYRPIDITAEKDGHKLRVYARRGYYASAAQPASGVSR